MPVRVLLLGGDRRQDRLSYELLDCRSWLGNVDWFVFRLSAGGVGTAVDLSALNSSACQDRGPAFCPVIAAGLRIDAGGASEFSCCQSDRGFKQAALVETFEKRAVCGVEGRSDGVFVIADCA